MHVHCEKGSVKVVPGSHHTHTHAHTHTCTHAHTLNPSPSHPATPLSGRPLAVLGVNCRHILLYNLAVQQLHAGHPLAAFDSLLEVVQVYHTNPRLWLRLAESCMAAHYKVGSLSATQ